MSQLFKNNKLVIANQLKTGENQSGVIALNEPPAFPAVQQIAQCSNRKQNVFELCWMRSLK